MNHRLYPVVKHGARWAMAVVLIAIGYSLGCAGSMNHFVEMQKLPFAHFLCKLLPYFLLAFGVAAAFFTLCWGLIERHRSRGKVSG
jgi:hypothetical protein